MKRWSGCAKTNVAFEVMFRVMLMLMDDDVDDVDG